MDPVLESSEEPDAPFTWQAQLETCRLVASSDDAFNHPLPTDEEKAVSPLDRNNYFKSCQWSPDGTTLLTANADNVLRTFILPPALLTDSNVQSLTAYHVHTAPGPAYATAFHPSFILADPSTTVYLASIPDLPLRLLSPFSRNVIASYPLVNPDTEAFVAPHSIIFDKQSDNATNFIVGSNSEISIFDLNRPGESPHATLKTIPSKRKKIVGGGVGMKGLVSCLDLSSDGLLAAGTFTRWVGIYDGAGRGSEVGVFQLGKDQEDRDGVGDGKGVTQLQWTRDGRYLIAAERMSDGLSIWDVRGTGKRLAWLAGRGANTMQRITFDVVDDAVIAGDTEGNVRLWTEVGQQAGVQQAALKVKLHQDAISSTSMHPSAAVLATCSGQRHHDLTSWESLALEDSEEAASSITPPSTFDGCPTIDNSLKIWSLYPDVLQGSVRTTSGQG